MPLPQDVAGALSSLVVGLINYQSPPTGAQPARYYSTIFRDLPNRTLYPDYYVVIKEPRSLNGVLDSINRGIYSSPHAVAYDLFLIWSNAREYNLPGSIVCQDADVLEHKMKKLWKERRPALPSWKTLLRPQDLDPSKAKSALPSSKPPSAPPASASGPGPSSGTPTANGAPKMKFKLKTSFGGSPSPAPPAAVSPAPPHPQPQARSSPALATSTPQPVVRATNKLRIAEPAPPPSAPSVPTVATPTANTTSSGSFTLKLKAPSAPSAPSPVVPATVPAPSPPKPKPPLPVHLPSQHHPKKDKEHRHHKEPHHSKGTGSSKHDSLSKKRPREEANQASPTPAAIKSEPSSYTNGLPALPVPPPPAPKAKKKKELVSEGQAQAQVQQRAMVASLGSQYQQQREMEQVPREPPGPNAVEDVENGWMGHAGSNPQETYLSIVNKLRNYTDTSGRQLAVPLLTVPDAQQRPDYHELITDPIALDTIEARIHEGFYMSPEAFDRDLHRLFTVAKVFVRPDSPGTVYADIIVLQRVYFELTKTPTGVRVPAMTEIRNEDGSVVSIEGERAVVGSRVTHKDKNFLNAIKFKGELLQAGDWVHLLNPDNARKPIIAQIFKVFKRPESPQRCLSVCWYMRPEDTVHPASRQFYENEVFKTGNFADHPVEDFVERIMVMFVTRYVRGRPKPPTWNPAMPLYVCEHRYRDDVKAFKKIKNWQSCLPEEVRKHEYTFEPFRDDAVETIPRVPSPFLRGIVGPGSIGEPLQHEEEQARYHVDGGTASADFSREANERRYHQEEAAAQAAAAQAAAAAIAAGGTGFAPPGGDPSFFFNPQGNFGGIDTPGLPDLSDLPPVEMPTPAEMAIANEAFAPLPSNIASKFRSNAFGDLLWFTAPGAIAPTVKRPTHTLDYLYWRATQGKNKLASTSMQNGTAVDSLGDVNMA